MSENSVRIKSYRGQYELRRTDDIASELDIVVRDGDFIIIDENVLGLHGEILGKFADRDRCIKITPDEHKKSYENIGRAIDGILESGFKKNNRIIAVGGGVIQDICAFTASILFRGVGWVFVPTNLLTQADSCIGSKTSVNFGSYKNQLGGFYPPSLILVDGRFLKTLSMREIRSGLGEILHYFLVGGADDMNRFDRECLPAMKDSLLMNGLIDRSLEIKKAMVERDEFDEGPRNIFNYGHSFGHALESCTEYDMPHGIAVCFGMDMANTLSMRLGMIDEETLLRMRKIIYKICMPWDFPQIDTDKFFQYLKKDKKNHGTSYRLILTKGAGDMFVHTLDDSQILKETVGERLNYFYAEASSYEAG